MRLPQWGQLRLKHTNMGYQTTDRLAGRRNKLRNLDRLCGFPRRYGKIRSRSIRVLGAGAARDYRCLVLFVLAEKTTVSRGQCRSQTFTRLSTGTDCNGRRPITRAMVSLTWEKLKGLPITPLIRSSSPEGGFAV